MVVTAQTVDRWRDDHVLGHPLVAVPEPDRLTDLGIAYCIDWTRRRLTAAGEGRLSGWCLHGVSLTTYCGECSADLDVLAGSLLP